MHRQGNRLARGWFFVSIDTIMPVVSIKKIGSSLHTDLELLLQPYENDLQFVGKSVLIKPNLVEPETYITGQTTNPALVEAIIVWCKERGAAKIAIGEGPSYFQPHSELHLCFTRTGIADMARRQSVPWILFDDGTFREFKNHSERTPHHFSISEHAFSWDHIINVPVPKPHYLTTVSIAMKNLKGFIKREDKPSFHYCGNEGIHGSVTELNRIIRPSLNIVDCTAPVHQNKDFLVAGIDIVATDTITASLMGINPHSIKTIRLGFEAGLGEMDMTCIDIVGDDLKDLKMCFEQPVDYLSRVFPKLILSATTACSGCLIPLFSILRRLENLDIQPSQKTAILLGRGLHDCSRTKIISIGQCALQYKCAGPRLGGCPPTKEELFEFLKTALLA